MAAARTCGGWNPERSADVACEKGTATANTSVHQDVLHSRSGDYILTAKVCTSNDHQTLQLLINDASTPTTLKLPFTLGKWNPSEPVTLTLKQGKNKLHFWRDQAPQSGVALKEFTLKPVVGSK